MSLYLSPGPYLVSYYCPYLFYFVFFFLLNTKIVGILKNTKNREKCGVSLGNKWDINEITIQQVNVNFWVTVKKKLNERGKNMLYLYAKLERHLVRPYALPHEVSAFIHTS